MALQQLAEAAREQGGAPPALRELITAGEQLRVTPALAALCRDGARLFNTAAATGETLAALAAPFALVSVAAIVAAERGTITAARVAFGGVAHKPWRSIEAEAALKGHPATLSTYRAAADAAMRSAAGQGHNDFKIELARRTLCRTLADAAQASIGR